MTANACLLPSLPAAETIYGDGFTCPGCGLPFYTERTPGKGPERAIHTGLDTDRVEYSDDGPRLLQGSLILCEQCIKNLAAVIGWIDPEAGKARTSDVRRAQRRDEKVREAADAVKAAHEAAHDLCNALDAVEDELGL